MTVVLSNHLMSVAVQLRQVAVLQAPATHQRCLKYSQVSLCIYVTLACSLH